MLILTIASYSQLVRKTSSVREINRNGKVMRITQYCIKGKTSSSQLTRNGIVASKDYPLGTRLLIGGQVYTVLDTGGFSRGTLDIWTSNCTSARKFGVKRMSVQVL